MPNGEHYEPMKTNEMEAQPAVSPLGTSLLSAQVESQAKAASTDSAPDVTQMDVQEEGIVPYILYFNESPPAWSKIIHVFLQSPDLQPLFRLLLF